MDFDHVATNPELAAGEGDVVALEEEVDQFLEEFVAPDFLAHPDREHGFFVILGRTETVDAGDGSDDDDILSREHRTHG
jgi:hypothetical protein